MEHRVYSKLQTTLRVSAFPVNHPAGLDHSARDPPPWPAPTAPPMNKLCIFAGTILGSYAGWWAGDALGFGFFGAFFTSGAGSLLGVWLGWKLARKLE